MQHLGLGRQVRRRTPVRHLRRHQPETFDQLRCCTVASTLNPPDGFDRPTTTGTVINTSSSWQQRTMARCRAADSDVTKSPCDARHGARSSRRRRRARCHAGVMAGWESPGGVRADDRRAFAAGTVHTDEVGSARAPDAREPVSGAGSLPRACLRTPSARIRSPIPKTKPRSRQLARDVAERELAPMARHGDETEEFPQWAWDGMRKAELFGITIGEKWGGAGLGDVEAAIVLEELGRADVSSAILAQLIFNGPPRAIEHLGYRRAEGSLAADRGERRRAVLHRHQRDRSRQRGRPHARQAHARRRRLPAQRYKNYVTGGHKARACLVWCRFPGSEEPRASARSSSTSKHPDVTIAGTHVKMGCGRRARPSSRSTTCASNPKTSCSGATPPTASRSRP